MTTDDDNKAMARDVRTIRNVVVFCMWFIAWAVILFLGVWIATWMARR